MGSVVVFGLDPETGVAKSWKTIDNVNTESAVAAQKFASMYWHEAETPGEQMLAQYFYQIARAFYSASQRDD